MNPVSSGLRHSVTGCEMWDFADTITCINAVTNAEVKLSEVVKDSTLFVMLRFFG